jgi:hypothetical protein
MAELEPSALAGGRQAGNKVAATLVARETARRVEPVQKLDETTAGLRIDRSDRPGNPRLFSCLGPGLSRIWANQVNN